jgi:hypothetical protein
MSKHVTSHATACDVVIAPQIFASASGLPTGRTSLLAHSCSTRDVLSTSTPLTNSLTMAMNAAANALDNYMGEHPEAKTAHFANPSNNPEELADPSGEKMKVCVRGMSFLARTIRMDVRRDPWQSQSAGDATRRANAGTCSWDQLDLTLYCFLDRLLRGWERTTCVSSRRTSPKWSILRTLF